jgi:hypothetical protein
MSEDSAQKTVCGYAFRNTKTGLFKGKGLTGWNKKPHIWNKEHHIKALITTRVKEMRQWRPDMLDFYKAELSECEIIEVIIESGRSKSMLFNLDWLDK